MFELQDCRGLPPDKILGMAAQIEEDIRMQR
jgi:hypothetical protein